MNKTVLKRYIGIFLVLIITIGILFAQGGVIEGPNGESGCTTTPDKNVGVCLQKVGNGSWVCVKPINKYENLTCSS